ncbi:unnamed protein product [Nippostrongylus brasiliensis]|uniref:PPM-type phosphatase domain-containing protein n=1 Tax=Nippostrongylus brasiliensis TaxID=27835 RepID=A0A0N4Y5A9_NIPBR|nr:hypothetical protein Q1695_000262 [Nippostrongylus brasiliensis]VDL74749.1 unnamed protein product [Nippostrongylus brasiliensis]
MPSFSRHNAGTVCVRWAADPFDVRRRFLATNDHMDTTSRLRTHMVKAISSGSRKKIREELEDFELETGISASSSIWTEGAYRISPRDLRTYFQCTNTIAQFSKDTNALSMADTVSMLTIRALIYRVGESELYSLPRTSSGVTVLVNAGHCKGGGSAPLSTIGAAFVHRNQMDLEAVTPSMGSITTGPAFPDVGTLGFLAESLARRQTQWKDEAPLLRNLLLNDTLMDAEDVKHDVMWSEVLSDAKMLAVYRSKEFPKEHDIAECRCVIITLDTYAMLRTFRKDQNPAVVAMC